MLAFSINFTIFDCLTHLLRIKTIFMKTLVYFFAVIMSASVLFSGCEEIEKGLLDDLAEGKMVVIFDDGEEELLDCTYGQYGESTEGFNGEVFINGFMQTTDAEKHLSIMYGSYSNQTALTAKAYSTANEEDMIMVHGSYGNIDTDANVTIVFITVAEDGIKGTFTGKLKTEDGIKNISGAFWAIKQQEQPH